MRMRYAVAVVVASQFFTHAAVSSTTLLETQEVRYSVGGGFGLMYTGLGLSFARQAQDSFGYVSLGCLGWTSESEGNCGVSAVTVLIVYFQIRILH